MMARPRTIPEACRAEIVDRYVGGEKVEAIAAALGTSVPHVCRLARSAGAPCRSRRKVDGPALATAWNDGVVAKELAYRFSCDLSTIYRSVKRASLPPRRRRAR